MAQFITFLAENEYYAIELAQVLAITGADTIVKAPKQPKYIEGVAMAIDGNFPVLNMSRILGNKKIMYKGPKSVMAINIEGTKTGFTVDQVYEVIVICEKNELPFYITELKTESLLNEGQMKRIQVLEQRN